jgi:hypothetical protein
MIRIGRCISHYGRYPGMRVARLVGTRSGAVELTVAYRVPVDRHDINGSWPESQFHRIRPDGSEGF